MSFFNTILSYRGLSVCPTPLWKLKVTDEEYEQLRQFLFDEYTHVGSFRRCPKESALYWAEWWKRHSAEKGETPFASLGFDKNKIGDSLLFESAKRVFDSGDYNAYIPGLQLVKINRGREYKYSLYFQGGFPMGLACSKKGSIWSNRIKQFVKRNLDFGDKAGTRIAKKALREYKEYLVSAAREQKPDGMPFLCDENHPWYKKAVEGIQEGDKERGARPFRIRWFISSKGTECIIKCQIIGPSRIEQSFLSQYPVLRELESIPVQLFVNDVYKDTLIEYHKTGKDTFFSYYELDKTIIYDGESKISLRIPGLDQPIIVSDVDMNIPHSFYLTSSGEYLMGAHKFGERTCIIIYDDDWMLKESNGPHTVLNRFYNGKSYSFLTCGVPDDDMDISFIIVKKNSNEEYRFGSDIIPTWTQVDLLKPYNNLIIEDLYDFSNMEQVCVKEMNDEEEDGTIATPECIYFRTSGKEEWDNKEIPYGKVQCSVIHRKDNIYSAPEKNLISVGPNFNVKILHYDSKEETHYKIEWDGGDIYATNGKVHPKDGIWVIRKNDYESTVELTCIPHKGAPFNINLRAVYRDFNIFSPSGESVKRHEIIPWSELSSYRYSVRGLEQINVQPYRETSIKLPIKTDKKIGIPEDGSMSLLLSPDTLKKYEWRANDGCDFAIRYSAFTLMRYPLALHYNCETREISLSLANQNLNMIDDTTIKENRAKIVSTFKGHLLVINSNGVVLEDIARNDDGLYILPEIPNNCLIISNIRGYVRPVLFNDESISPIASIQDDAYTFKNSKLDDKCWDTATTFLKIGLEHDIPLHDLPQIGSIISDPGLILALYCRNVILAGSDPEKISNVQSSMNRLLTIGNKTIADLEIDTYLSVCHPDCFVKQFEEWQRIYSNNSRNNFIMSIAGKVEKLITEL